MPISAQFEAKIEITTKNFTTLTDENYRYFTIPAKVRRDWRNAEGEGTYSFKVDPKVKEKYQEHSIIVDILAEMEDENIHPRLTISANEGRAKVIQSTDANGKPQLDVQYAHYRCHVSHLLLQKLKVLLISTFVYSSQKKNLPRKEPESFTLRYDTSDMTVTMVDMDLYLPDDPYLNFARTAAYHTSFNTAFKLHNTDKINDFYSSFSPWFDVSTLSTMREKKAEIYDVIYMLYDCNANTFYVGRADELVTRLKQHQDKLAINEPIPDFTHFRYSKISSEYEEYSYLIENSAIHDCAWLFNMPQATHYQPSLQSAINSRKIPGDLNSIKMVNNVEHQTRLRDKKK